MCATSADPKQDFTRRSATESICMYCFLTVRVQSPYDLDTEERVHASLCLERPDIPHRSSR